MSSIAKTQTYESFSRPSFESGYKFTGGQKNLLWNLLEAEPDLSSVELLRRFEAVSGGLSISIRHLNRTRLLWRVPGPRGRPKGCKSGSCQSGEIVYLERNLSYIGIHFFADWMEGEGRFSQVIEALVCQVRTYFSDHPEESFSLLNHKIETIEHRFKVLFYAPLFGVKKLSELDLKEHPLKTLIGRNYQSSTLNQFLGQLERVSVGRALMEVLLRETSAQICYIDGHMVPFWSSRSMHKGKITMLGRIMSGSNAVIAHDEKGNSLFAKLYPPDFHMNEFIVRYCQQIASHTEIELFVIDREINSLKMASIFEEKHWGLLSMLDRNQYKGIEDWDLKREGSLKEGEPVYSGQWKDEEKRKDDPRYFVIVVLEEKLLPYWATSKFKETFPPIQWPEIYSDRTEIQENCFKRMIGRSLNTNYGTKVIAGPDRHQQRQLQELKEESDKISKKRKSKEVLGNLQKRKVEKSIEQGHGKRLEQRQTHLEKIQQQQKQLEKKEQEVQRKIDECGAVKQRDDRDFRKQTIMLFRSLFLENSLQAFRMEMVEKFRIPICLETLLLLIFERGGTRIETATDTIYLINTEGLSLKYQNLLQKVVVGMNAMRIQHHGKRVGVQVRGSPGRSIFQAWDSRESPIKGPKITKTAEL